MTLELSSTLVSSLAQEHKAFAELLRRHQEALVSLLFVQALADLEEFSRRLRRHVQSEEQTLLPAYASLDRLPRRGDPRFFVEEHRKIEDQLSEILSMMRSMQPHAGAARAVVSLLEKEIRFRSLLEHHERREEQILFPRLLEALS